MRRLLKPLEPKRSDVEFKVRLALTHYNNFPQIRLEGRSPLQLLTGIAPVQFLSQLNPLDNEPKLSFTKEVQEEDFANWHEYLKILHNNFALRQINLYNSFPTPLSEFKVGQIVMVITPSMNLSKTHHNPAAGPFIVKEKNNNTYDLLEIGSNKRIKRNGRFIKKLQVSEEVEKHLLEKSRDNHTTNKIEFPSTNITNKINKLHIKGTDITPVEKGYNLQERK